MVEPTVIPRSEHSISRRDIDPDALKVLYRLRQFDHLAYLVGGSVRDLLLGRRPKDFDIGTSAHPYQVKKLFRNCWVIGRRFRLAHVKFGQKTIEVATFRCQLPPAADEGEAGAHVQQPVEAVAAGGHAARADAAVAGAHGARRREARPEERLIHRDNTFGTPEEDAFRRDFTINALFYDIATFSIIDYVGGLKDLQARTIRSIGDPEVRFLEDPVRMLRAVVMAARLDFGIDPPTLDAIAKHRAGIARSAPPRLMEEYYKILRSGYAERSFRGLAEAGLLEHLTPELLQPRAAGVWEALAALDAWRARFEAPPASLTTPILLGVLLEPLGLLRRKPGRLPVDRSGRPVEPRLMLGLLPIARRDAARLQLLLSVQPRLLDLNQTPRAKRGLMRRPIFPEALTWLDVRGTAPEVVHHWRTLMEAEVGAEIEGDADAEGEPEAEPVEMPRARRRRRRRRFRRRPGVREGARDPEE